MIYLRTFKSNNSSLYLGFIYGKNIVKIYDKLLICHYFSRLSSKWQGPCSHSLGITINQNVAGRSGFSLICFDILSCQPYIFQNGVHRAAIDIAPFRSPPVCFYSTIVSRSTPVAASRNSQNSIIEYIHASLLSSIMTKNPPDSDST